MEKFVLDDNTNVDAFIDDVYQVSKSGSKVEIDIYGYSRFLMAGLDKDSIKLIVLNILRSIKYKAEYKQALINNTELSLDEIERISKKGALELADTCFEYGVIPTFNKTLSK